jgi:hypothetical protein
VSGIVILISGKGDFKSKTKKRDWEIRYILIKVSIQKDVITIVRIYALNALAIKYIKQIINSTSKGKTRL